MSRQRVAIGTLGASAVLLVSLAVHEGYRQQAYIPVEGDVPTIGFGTTGGVEAGDTTDPVTALQRMLVDVERFEGAMKRCVSVPLHQHEYDAFLSLSYNVGASAFCGSTLVRKLNAGDHLGACAEIDRWVNFRGKPLPGLVKRRAKERALCEGKN